MLQIRQVCRTLKGDVDYDIGIAVRIVDAIPTGGYREFLESVVIRSLCLENYICGSLGLQLLKPLALRELIIFDRIQFTVLEQLINSCRHLENLRISGVIEQVPKFVKVSNEKKVFPRLTELNLDFCFWTAFTDPDMESRRLLLLPMISAPKLVKFCYKEFSKVNFQHEATLNALTQFLQWHRTIQHMYLTLHTPMGIEDGALFTQIQQKLEYAGRLLNLTTLQIEIASGHDSHGELWTNFILTQKKLETFCYNSPFNELRYYGHVIENNYRSLKIIWITTSMATPFDFSVLDKCAQLEELGLQKYGSMRSPEGDTVNFTKLPENLNFLSVSHMSVPSGFIKHVAQLKKLKYLALISLDMEVDLKYFRKLLALRNLEAILLKEVYSTCTGSKKELTLKKLKTMSEQLKSQDDDIGALVSIRPKDFSRWFAVGDLIGFSTSESIEPGCINFL